jgi:uncharacterized protein YwqG
MEQVKNGVFEFTGRQKEMLEKRIEEGKLTKKKAELFKKFVKKHARPCYYLRVVKGEEPTALDSSIGGVAMMPMGVDIPENEKGEELPLFVQLNFDGVDLPGYPDKGILQIFMEEDDSAGGFEDVTPHVRFYKNIPDEYRKDVECSDHMFAGSAYGYACVNNITHFKINLERGWAVYPFLQLFFHEEHISLFAECDIFKEIIEGTKAYKESGFTNLKDVIDDLSDAVEEAFEFLEDDDYEFFPLESNIGGYGMSASGYEPYLPEEMFLFLDSTVTVWGGDENLVIERDFEISCDGGGSIALGKIFE